MKISKQSEQLIKKFISDEISESELNILEEEAKTNKALSDILKLHKELGDPELTFELADDKEFKKMRAITINRIHHAARKKTYRGMQLVTFVNNLFRKPAFSVAFAAVMFLAGFFIQTNPEQKSLIKNIQLASIKSDNIEASSNSPYIISNASFKEKKNGTIQVNFDVSRHLELERSKDDPFVKEILAQSLLNSETSSQRLKNIDASETIMAPKIKQALILTMLNDNNAVVRQKSLFSLLKYPNDKDIQDALLKVLNSEESVFMRLAAIDYLANNNIDQKLLNQQIGNTDLQENSAVSAKIKQLELEGTQLK